jgi:hypothetical protein
MGYRKLCFESRVTKTLNFPDMPTKLFSFSHGSPGLIYQSDMKSTGDDYFSWT